jgi:hypothetical protein
MEAFGNLLPFKPHASDNAEIATSARWHLSESHPSSSARDTFVSFLARTCTLCAQSLKPTFVALPLDLPSQREPEVKRAILASWVSDRAAREPARAAQAPQAGEARMH